jgi:hypothetical protein
LEQIRQVVLKKTGAGFPAMCEQYLFDRGFGRQPATAADVVSVMVEGELVAFPEQIRSPAGRTLLRGGEKAKCFEDGFAGRGQ